MGRNATKSNENPCFQCRKAAARYNDKLSSREGAAEMLGISVSSLADYELGITKVIPVDKLVLMAELYNAPEMKTWYCSNECPIGRGFPIPDEPLSSVERTTLRLLRILNESKVEESHCLKSQRMEKSQRMSESIWQKSSITLTISLRRPGNSESWDPRS